MIPRMALITCQNISIAFGGHPLLNEASLCIERGERIGLLGRNGEGKSTLLKILSEELNPDSGEIVRERGMQVSMLSQQVPDDLTLSVAEIIREGLTTHSSSDHPVQKICSLMNLPEKQRFSTLSGGQKRRCLLGRALVSEPDLLLLDEPTNHLDIDSIIWLEQFLNRFNGSLFFVTHDRAFLQRLAKRIVELDRGRLSSWACNYPTFLKRKEEWLAGEEEQWAQFDKKLAQEEIWIRQGIKARRTRNEGRVRNLERLRKERSGRRERSGDAKIAIHTASRSGRKVIEAKKLTHQYLQESGEILSILDDFSTTVMRGDRIGIIGPNGCGKTTLLNILLGRNQPDNGTVEHGTKMQVSYFDQHRQQLDPEKSVFENLADGNDMITIGGHSRHVISYLQDFLFSPDRIRQPVRCLSGGERNRLLLARLFTKPSNVLVLDEPTNDLDTDTLELLESQLMDYSGTVLMVSHDRDFLDNICSSTLVFESEGILREYVGGYTDWKEQFAKKRQTTTAAAATPTSTAKRPAGTKKLSNRERDEWKQLPIQIETLEQEQEQLTTKMADPAFFKKEPAEVRKVSERANAIPELIDSAFERWAELDERT